MSSYSISEISLIDILRRTLAVGAILFGTAAVDCSVAAVPMEINQLLKKADDGKTSDYPNFKKDMEELKSRQAEFQGEQKQYFRYLEGWEVAYEGDYEAGIVILNDVIANSKNATIQFRAGATIVNALSIVKRHEEALSRLSQLLEKLPTVSDPEARDMGLAVAARVYNQDGQFDLGLTYAHMLEVENFAGGGLCKGGQMRLEALFKSGKLNEVTPDFDAVINACNKLGQSLRAILVRTFIARIHLANNRPEDALKILGDHYDEVKNTQYPNLIAEFESLMAQGYRATGDSRSAKQYAQRAVDHSVKNEYTTPLIVAYRLLYSIAKEQGDTAASLAFHEKYAAADKGYLDDSSARQLAYQRSKHEAEANRLEIEALNKQNEVLTLQRQLGDKAVENFRLYIVLSTVVLAFILLWAYFTKRSQMHFMKLSRQDGLTGLFNRPHFIDQSVRALNAAKKSGQAICVVICDLDYFKAINDNLGHATGDDVLKQTAAAFQSRMQKHDIVGRLGGEEFGLLFVGCEMAEARERCERMRTVLAEIVVDQHGSQKRLSASFGISTTASSGHEFRQLLAHADSALYRAKRTGRDRVVLHGDEGADNAVVEMDAARLTA